MRPDARISTALLASILAEARGAPMMEVCGLLLGTADAIAAHLPARNVAADRRTTFEIDPATLLAAPGRPRSLGEFWPSLGGHRRRALGG